MTAMRMAQNGEQPSQPVSQQYSNPASSYQTANPQQLRAAGIQPVIINDRQLSRNRQQGRSSAFQLAAQYNTELNYNGNSPKVTAGHAGHYSSQSQYPSRISQNLPALNHTHSLNHSLPHQVCHIPNIFTPSLVTMPSTQEFAGRRGLDVPLHNLSPLQRLEPMQHRDSSMIHQGNSGRAFGSRPINENDFSFAQERLTVMQSRFESAPYGMLRQSSNDYSRRLPGLHEYQNDHFQQVHHQQQQQQSDLFAGISSDLKAFPSNGSSPRTQQLFSVGSQDLRSPLQSAGHPEVSQSTDDDLSQPRTRRTTSRLPGYETDDIFGHDFQSIDFSVPDETVPTLATKQFDVNGRKVGLHKSRSESLLPPDQLPLLHGMNSFGGHHVDLSAPVDDSRCNDFVEVTPTTGAVTDSPTEKLSRFPMLKSKTAPKLMTLNGLGSDSPSASPSMKLFGRKKFLGFSSPHGVGNDSFLASEVAEAVLGNSPSAGNTPPVGQKHPRLHGESAFFGLGKHEHDYQLDDRLVWQESASIHDHDNQADELPEEDGDEDFVRNGLANLAIRGGRE